MIRLPDGCYKFHDSYWAFFPTMRCNGRCRYCIVQGRGRIVVPDELLVRVWLEFWNDVEHDPSQRLSILGGEPTLYKGFLDLVNGLSTYNLTVTTNLGTKFYDDKLYKEIVPRKGLRVNTTFHPNVCDIDTYCRRVLALREAGLYIDQIAMVFEPGMWPDSPRCNREVCIRCGACNPYQVAADDYGLKIRMIPFLGFYADGKFAREGSVCDPAYLRPNEQNDPKMTVGECGIKDLEVYRKVCGAALSTPGECRHHYWSFLVSSDGNIYPCHYKLYYRIDCEGNIMTREWDIPQHPVGCDYLGFCNWCDLPRKYWSGDLK